mmetsp:Transcript_35978/g.73972  ORF Transcript_35978/g.73972 Transcript_35978/m.73972 type:complete len:297 (+) Transcript_35978:55-945(+)|eukprot:CAMPEP_0181308784 /NCGR_PEP_ID=MMETSP1101-20121128/11661_1 /TAXON_ID=46948 /ORGANISM="Rhodomonas abbreviata, Strain Caron Lab Isolate" /LENGTH=296 /DNA_ID=CAMNT_0023415217 /DNA_START=44 /DNA_END=934 /DNA_ORIENTATION=-
MPMANLAIRMMLLLAVVASVSAFTTTYPVTLRTGSAPALEHSYSPVRFPSFQTARARLRGVSLSMADEKPKGEDGDIAETVDSFTDLVKKVTGKPNYQFGDLSKASLERVTATATAVEQGSAEAMEKMVSKVSSPDYQFGDLSKSAAQDVIEWGQRERKAFETMTGKDYEFGDLSKFVANKVLENAQASLGPDYKFGDLTISAIKAAQKYQFGDISRGLMNIFQEKVVPEVEKSVSESVEAAAAMRLELLEQEKKIISQVLKNGEAAGADADEVQALLAQEMSYLESLSVNSENEK